MVKLLFIQRSLLQPSQLLALDVEDEFNFRICYCHLVPGEWLIFLSFTKEKLQWKIFSVLYQFSFIHRVNFHLFLVMVLWESLKTTGISVNIEHPTADRAMNIHGSQGFIFFKVFLILLFFVCFFSIFGTTVWLGFQSSVLLMIIHSSSSLPGIPRSQVHGFLFPIFPTLSPGCLTNTCSRRYRSLFPLVLFLQGLLQPLQSTSLPSQQPWWR